MYEKHALRFGRGQLAFILGAVLLLGCLPAETQAQGRSEFIVFRGGPAPDGNGVFSTLNAPQINEIGQTTFKATLAGTSGGVSDDTGIFSGSSSGITQIARKGQAAPDGNGTYFSVNTPRGTNTIGQTVFFVDLTGTNGSSADNSGIYSGNGGPITKIVRKGQAAPDANGVFSSTIPAGINEAGQTAFNASLLGTSGGGSRGIFSGSGGAITQIARSGQAAPDANGTFSAFSIPSGINEAGQTAFFGFLTGTSGGSSDDRGIYSGSGGAITQIVREGQAAPDANGSFFSVHNPTRINEAGQVAFAGDLTGTGGPIVRGIFIGSGDAPIQVAREGLAAPDANGTFSGISGPSGINEAGQTVFHSFLSGTNGGNRDNVGIFLADESGITQIARKGQAAPGANGTFSNFGTPLGINDAGQTVFTASLIGTSGGPTDDSGIYTGDGIDLLQIAREGDGNTGLSIGSRALNSLGQVAYQETRNDGRQAIRVFTPELHWRTSSDGSWESNSQWTLGLNPDFVHDVYIDPDASLTVAGPSSDTTVRSLFVAGPNSTGLATLELQHGSTITAISGVNVLANGILTGDGTISGSVASRGKVIADNLTFTNGVLGVFEGSVEGTGRIHGNISNKTNGSIRANNGNVLRLTGPSLSNSGRIEVIDGELQVAANVQNNSGTGLITGRDASMRFDGGVTNQGSIAITDGINDVFGDFDNTGTIAIGGDAEAIFYDDITQNGTFEVTAFGSRTASAIVLGGFTGSGGFTGGGDLFLLGDLRPGNSPASVLMDGNLFLGASTLTEFEFAGDVLGEFDQLLVTGDLNLAGGLAINLLDGFEFGLNQEYIVADIGGSRLGQFIGLGEGDLIGNFGGRELFISYSAGDGNDVGFFTSVPEPSTGVLGLFAAVGMWVRRRQRV